MEAAVNLSEEITTSLRVLGLEPGASASDVRKAFRHLARTCHPDVAGRGGMLRFQQITGAYTLLKGLAPEELRNLPRTEPRTMRGGLFGRYRDRKWTQERNQREQKVREAQKAKEKESEETRRAEERRRKIRNEHLDRVLDQYDESISRCLEQLEREADETRVNDILVRLGSSVPAVRRLALSHVGALINREDVRDALIEMLRHGEVDDGTARLIVALPMNPEVRRRIATNVAGNAIAFPDFLITSLLGSRDSRETPDPSLLERYLITAKPSVVALVLYRWPAGEIPTLAVLKRLLEGADSQVLVPLFAAMKQKFPQAVPSLQPQLTALLEHSDPRVRVWSRVFLSSVENIQ